MSKNIQIKTFTRDRTFSTSCGISRCMASNKHGHFSPAILLGVFLDDIKKLIHQAGLRINVKFVLGARVDQLCSTTTQNWKERDKNTVNQVAVYFSREFALESSLWLLCEQLFSSTPKEKPTARRVHCGILLIQFNSYKFTLRRAFTYIL